MDTSLWEHGYKRMSCNHTCCSLAVKTAQTWTTAIPAELIPTLWQSLVTFCRILSDLPYHNKASTQTCVLQDTPPTPKIGNPYWLTAILPAASWTSAAALSVICVCCVESVFRVHRETFNLAFVSLTSRRQVTLRRSALCSGIWRSRCVAFRGAWQLTSPSCG